MDTEGNTTPRETQNKVTQKMKRKTKESIEKKTKTLKRLKIEYVKINEIKPNKYNPNRQNEKEFELLCKSMKEDGFTQPIVLMQDGTIVDGEHRWRAAQTIGLTEIPAVKVHFTEEQRRIATLRHNRARGTEDMELTADVLRDLEKLGALDWAQDSLMLDDVEIQRLLEDIPPTEEYGKDHEYNEAWVPTREDQTNDTQNVATHLTEKAKRQQFIREDKLGKARTQEERDMAKQETKLTSITFTYTIEEYQLVNKALGPEPAKTLVTWCERELKKK